jgi:hypothetical protein
MIYFPREIYEFIFSFLSIEKQEELYNYFDRYKHIGYITTLGIEKYQIDRFERLYVNTPTIPKINVHILKELDLIYSLCEIDFEIYVNLKSLKFNVYFHDLILPQSLKILEFKEFYGSHNIYDLKLESLSAKEHNLDINFLPKSLIKLFTPMDDADLSKFKIKKLIIYAPQMQIPTFMFPETLEFLQCKGGDFSKLINLKELHLLLDIRNITFPKKCKIHTLSFEYHRQNVRIKFPLSIKNITIFSHAREKEIRKLLLKDTNLFELNSNNKFLLLMRSHYHTI